MAAELVSSATSDKLTEMDWTKNIEICELVASDHRQAKDVIKAIKKRLASKSPNVQLFAVMLLEMLMNNIGEPVHTQVIDTGLVPILVKIVKKKSDIPVREKIFLLLDAAQTSVGGAAGRFPQYYSAYTELVNAGLQFPQRPQEIPKPQITSNANKENPAKNESVAPQPMKNVAEARPKKVSDSSSILQKAGTALEVLRDVLNNVDTQRPEEAKDEFTLDLVEQCSFQKQRVMHLAVTSRDDQVISQALELNEQLERVLNRHTDLLAGRTVSSSNHVYSEQEEEEEEQLIRRIRKGKACLRPEDEEDKQIVRPIVHRPFVRPLKIEPQQEHLIQPPNMVPKQENVRPLGLELRQERDLGKQVVSLPPPPAKHVERERFFKENKGDGSSVNGQMASLSLHSRKSSSSRGASLDFSE